MSPVGGRFFYLPIPGSCSPISVSETPATLRYLPEAVSSMTGRAVAMGWKRSTSTVLLSLEGLLQWLFRRNRRLPVWRRKNGRRWVLDA